jgi:hypothetical protein
MDPKHQGEHMPLNDRLKQALEAAEAEAEQERQRIRKLIQGKPEKLARQIWDEESSIILRYYDDEVSVAETNLLLRDARRYHLPVPGRSDHSSWYESQLSGGRYLSSDAQRDLQRVLLEEGRREESERRARLSTWLAILGLGIAALALFKDVPIGAFLLDLVKAFKG